MASNYIANGKVDVKWCDRCGTLILGEKCSCNSILRTFKINAPGDIRPSSKDGKKLILALLKKYFGTTGNLDSKLIFFNKIPGEDRTDEIIAHGEVIGVLRFELESNDYSLELRQFGSELLKDSATKNIVKFGNMSGHLKGKSIPGENIFEIIGKFNKNEPLILLKGMKVGPGIALVDSDNLKSSEKAIKIKDLNQPSNTPLSPDADRNQFVKSNISHLKKIESQAVNEIQSYIKTNKLPISASFSGGKDSLAAYGVLTKIKKDPDLIFVDTGLEFPDTISYVDSFFENTTSKTYIASAKNAFWNNVDNFGPPAKDFRWCCKVCKLGPITDLIESKYPKGTITIEGNRMLESFARSKIGFVSKNPFVPNQINLNPIRKWNSSEVWGYIWMRNLKYNPLYEKDFERIGCHLCASSLASEWKKIESIHPQLYKKWETYLLNYAEEHKLPIEYVKMGFWRWKVLPPKMIKIAEENNIEIKPKTNKEQSIKILKGASSCAAGGYSMEAVLSISRDRDFSVVEDALRTVGEVTYSDEFEIALVKSKIGTFKIFGGGQISVVSNKEKDAEILFEKGIKATMRGLLCTSCGICEKKCARHAISIKNGLKINPSKCNSCGACEKSCMISHYYDKLI